MPVCTLFELTVVLPTLVAKYEPSLAQLAAHICFMFFLFVNVIGNMIFSAKTKSCLKKEEYIESVYCESCKTVRPENSWHCTQCNQCVRKRDHHCFFFARCIGMYNTRYYILFFGYLMITNMYAFYYNYYFISITFEDRWIILRLFRITNPVLITVITEPIGIVDVYVYYLFLNISFIYYAGHVFYVHFKNAVRGVNAYESKFPELWKTSEWRQNLKNVFGTRWYLAIVWPLSYSPLPSQSKTYCRVNVTV